MEWLQILVLFVAGTAAGTINTVVGSGSLVTFPVLVALGYPPVLANVTNNIGVLPGSISGAIAYRRELRGRMRSVMPLVACSAVGGLIGAVLLLTLPASAFDQIVPALIVVALVLVIASPWLKRRAAERAEKQADKRAEKGSGAADPDRGRSPVLFTATALTGVYGGYFGAAQGVILLAILSIMLPGGLQRANAYKNILAATANGAAAVVFVFSTPVAWLAALVIAVGAVVGGQLGGRIGHRLPPTVFRVIIVAVGIAAIVYFYVK